MRYYEHYETIRGVQKKSPKFRNQFKVNAHTIDYICTYIKYILTLILSYYFRSSKFALTEHALDLGSIRVTCLVKCINLVTIPLFIHIQGCLLYLYVQAPYTCENKLSNLLLIVFFQLLKRTVFHKKDRAHFYATITICSRIARSSRPGQEND